MLASPLYLQEREASADRPRVLSPFPRKFSVQFISLPRTCRQTCRSVLTQKKVESRNIFRQRRRFLTTPISSRNVSFGPTAETPSPTQESMDATNSLDNKYTIQGSSTLVSMSVIEKYVRLISFVEKFTAVWCGTEDLKRAAEPLARLPGTQSPATRPNVVHGNWSTLIEQLTAPFGTFHHTHTHFSFRRRLAS